MRFEVSGCTALRDPLGHKVHKDPRRTLRKLFCNRHALMDIRQIMINITLHDNSFLTEDMKQ